MGNTDFFFQTKGIREYNTKLLSSLMGHSWPQEFRKLRKFFWKILLTLICTMCVSVTYIGNTLFCGFHKVDTNFQGNIFHKRDYHFLHSIFGRFMFVQRCAASILLEWLLINISRKSFTSSNYRCRTEFCRKYRKFLICPEKFIFATEFEMFSSLQLHRK